MPAIGAYNVITLKGIQPQDTVMEVEDISRPDVDGMAFRQLAKKSNKVSMVSTVNCTDEAAAELLETNFRALQGTLVTLTLDSGEQITLVMVHRVETIINHTVVTAIGGVTPKGGTRMLRTQWVFQGTKV